MSVTEKGLVTRDFPGGGLVTEMDPQDAVSEELLGLRFSKYILNFSFKNTLTVRQHINKTTTTKKQNKTALSLSMTRC